MGPRSGRSIRARCSTCAAGASANTKRAACSHTGLPPKSSVAWTSRRSGCSSTQSCAVDWRSNEQPPARSQRALSAGHPRPQPQSAEFQAHRVGEVQSRRQQSAVRGPYSAVRATRRRHNQRRRLSDAPGLRLRDLQGIRLVDDGSGQRQADRRCRGNVRGVSDHAGGGGERARQARGFLWCARVSEPDQMREPRRARHACGAAGQRRAGDDRIGEGFLMLDTARIRPDFPLLARQENGQRLVYLDNAATSQKPRKVIEAIVHYYTFHNANVHRGAYALAVEATDAYEAARTAVARFVNAWAREGVVFTRGTTESINLVAASWGRTNVRRGDTVVVTAMDHHSNIVPWQILCQEKGATLRMVEITGDGRIDLADFGRALEAKPKLVAFPYVSNSLGTVNPAAQLIKLAHSAGAVTVVDGAQSSPHLQVDVQELDCDFYALSGHKMLAPMGSGALIAKPALLEAMPPYHGGGEMIERVWDDRSSWNKIPHKFEGGTPNVEAAVGLGAAIAYLEQLGMDRVAEHESALARVAVDRLSQIEGVTVYGPPDHRAGVVPFTYGDIHPHDLATILDKDGVCIRAGHHCTQPLMRRLGVAATARASFYIYNDVDDIDALVAAVRKAGELFGVPA